MLRPGSFARCHVMEKALLFFDADNPYWNKDLLNLAGEDAGALKRLFKAGLVERTPLGNYVLTRKGRSVLLDYAAEYGVPLNLPDEYVDENKAVWTTKFQILFDRSFAGRWSLKEYRHNVCMSFYPGLKGKEIWEFSAEGKIRWLYYDNPMVRALLKKYPESGLRARDKNFPDLREVMAWLGEQEFPEGSLYVDLLFLSRYDFPHYASFPPVANDIWGFLNADRMFCFRSPETTNENLDDFVDLVANVRLFLLYYSHVLLPGYIHFDTENQENLNWIVWVAETDEKAQSILRLLKPLAPSLVCGQLPLHLKILSLENLQNLGNFYETIYDLMFHESLNVASPDGL